MMVADNIHKSVQAHYEANPYPANVNYINPKQIDFKAYFERQYLLPITLNQSMPLRILVAGCGTGQQFFDTTLHFNNSQIIGVDLSTKSLEIASEALRRHQITNIQLVHADITGQWITKIEPFNYIEAVGILHHLNSPREGLKHLTEKLLVGGIMLIGIYSQVARRPVEQAKAWIKQHHYTDSIEDIRALRHRILTEAVPFKSVRLFRDFYNLAECRDLLFHVQEQSYTLLDIQMMLENTGLGFLGFKDITPSQKQSYKMTCPQDVNMDNLASWHQYEQANPDTFRGLYQFYAQKIR